MDKLNENEQMYTEGKDRYLISNTGRQKLQRKEDFLSNNLISTVIFFTWGHLPCVFRLFDSI